MRRHWLTVPAALLFSAATPLGVITAVLATAAAHLPAGEADQEATVTWSADRLPLSEGLRQVGQRNPRTPAVDYTIAAGPVAATPVTMDLRRADTDAIRQAFAHAAGRWWAPAADDPQTAVLTGAMTPPRGRLRVDTHTSGLTGAANSAGINPLEDTVRALMAPWLAAEAGGANVPSLTYEPDSGTWTATLDEDGQSRLVGLLSDLQRLRARVPPLLADSREGAAAQVWRDGNPLRLPAGGWSAWCRTLADALDGSVALAAGVGIGADAPAVELPLDPGGLAERLAAVHLRIAEIHGVWCVGHEPPMDDLHPALRRRIAILPIPHLVTEAVSGARIAAALARRVPDLPGWGVHVLPDGRTLLVAADTASIHGVLDLLDRLDRAGQATGLESLERQPTP